MYKKSMFLIRDLMQERDRLNNLLQKWILAALTKLFIPSQLVKMYSLK
jgi:hypothetical protein